MVALVLRTAVALALAAGAAATTGVDVSESVSESEWECLMTPGEQGSVEFAIPRVYRSSGTVDPYGAATITAARSAGVPYVDGYIFPCYSCGNAGGQVSTTVSSLSGVDYGMLWYDVETYAWSSSQSSNQAFIQDMIDEGLSLGVVAGIYTNYYNWESVVGLDWDYPASKGLPLWYAHYDDSQSFSDFTAFGGWTSPNIKQYMGDETSCGVGVDYDWYSSSADFRLMRLEAARKQGLHRGNRTATA